MIQLQRHSPLVLNTNLGNLLNYWKWLSLILTLLQGQVRSLKDNFQITQRNLNTLCLCWHLAKGKLVGPSFELILVELRQKLYLIEEMGLIYFKTNAYCYLIHDFLLSRYQKDHQIACILFYFYRSLLFDAFLSVKCTEIQFERFIYHRK